jgi:hypothetical protein
MAAEKTVEEAFMAGYRAGHEKGVKKALGLIYDLGPEVRKAFQEAHPVDAAGRSLWENPVDLN